MAERQRTACHCCSLFAWLFWGSLLSCTASGCIGGVAQYCCKACVGLALIFSCASKVLRTAGAASVILPASSLRDSSLVLIVIDLCGDWQSDSFAYHKPKV